VRLLRKITAALMLMTSAPTFAEVTFDSSFECGNATAFRQIDPATWEFEIEQDTASSDRQWYYFSVNGAAGQEITFRLKGIEETNVKSHWKTARPVFSTDNGETWAPAPGATSATDDVYTFTHRFTAASERIAFHYPYTWTLAQRRIAEWDAHPDAELTTIGKSVEGRPIQKITITDATSKPRDGKLGFWLVARQHSAEVTASYTMDAFMDFLLSDEPEAIQLRKKAVINTVPMANPDGVVAGNYRDNIRGVNLNRVWNKPSPETSPEILAITAAIDAWVAEGNPYQLFADIHSTAGPRPHFAYHAGPSQRPALYANPAHYNRDLRDFLMLVNDFAPHFDNTRGGGASAETTIAQNHQRVVHGAMSFTFEGSYNRQNHGPNAKEPMTLKQHQDVGIALAKAMVTYFELGTEGAPAAGATEGAAESSN